MSQTSNRPGAADSGPINRQSLAGGGISASQSLPKAGDNRHALQALLNRIDLGEAMRRQAWLILCKLEPVQTVLDIDGELS
jgi:hypothetical protein